MSFFLSLCYETCIIVFVVPKFLTVSRDRAASKRPWLPEGSPLKSHFVRAMQLARQLWKCDLDIDRERESEESWRKGGENLLPHSTHISPSKRSRRRLGPPIFATAEEWFNGVRVKKRAKAILFLDKQKRLMSRAVESGRQIYNYSTAN